MIRKGSRKLPYYFSREELFKIADNIDEPRVMVAFTLALFCGLRLSEVCKLKFSDINFEKGVLTVRDGKMPYKKVRGYGKDRIVPIPEKVMPVLNMWKNINKEEHLFPSIANKVNHIHPYYLSKVYKEILDKTGINQVESKNSIGRIRHKYTFHTLRHTYATLLWEKTGDIYAVKAALGHSNIDTTMVYTHISDKALSKKVNDAFDFGANFIKNLREETMVAPKPVTPEINPLDFLKMRLIRGEIDLEKYRNIAQEISPKIDVGYIG